MAVYIPSKMSFAPCVEFFLDAGMQTRFYDPERPESCDLYYCYEVTKFVRALLNDTLHCIKRFEPKKFDPNVGDAQCQTVALIVRQILLKMRSSEELTLLERQLNKVQVLEKPLSLSLERSREFRVAEPPSPAQLKAVKDVSTELGAIALSVDFQYLVLARLLAELRKRKSIDEDGVITTHTDVGALNAFTKSLVSCQPCPAFCCGFVARAQSVISSCTQERLVALTLEPRLRRVVEEVHPYAGGSKYHPPKYFVLQLYSVKAVLDVLRREKAVVALKSIVPKGEKSFYHLIRLEEERSPLEAVDDTCVVVFAAVMKEEGGRRLTLEDLRALLTRYSFQEIALAEAARSAPYHPESTVADIADPTLREEVEVLKAQRLEVEEAARSYCIKFDHVYATTLKALQKEVSL